MFRWLPQIAKDAMHCHKTNISFTLSWRSLMVERSKFQKQTRVLVEVVEAMEEEEEEASEEVEVVEEGVVVVDLEALVVEAVPMEAEEEAAMVVEVGSLHWWTPNLYMYMCVLLGHFWHCQLSVVLCLIWPV